MVDTIQQERSKNYIKQIKGSVFYKAGAIAATFLALPIMVQYLGVELFGIWATMLTFVTWVMLFDLGIGNGLKNKVSETLADGKSSTAAEYVSTAYCLFGLISVVCFSLFFIAARWVSWQDIFNTQSVPEHVLLSAISTLALFVFLNFFLSLVNQVYHGLQKTSFVVFGQFVSNSIALVFVFLLNTFFDTSLVYVSWAYGAALIVSSVILNIALFYSKPTLKPRLKFFDGGKVRSLFSLGSRFFIIQLAVMVIFLSDKILIVQLLGPMNVTPYEVVFKLFSVFTIAHGLIIAPLWPAFSDAYARNQMEWIRQQLKRQVQVASVLFLLSLLLAFAGPLVVKLWIGEDLEIDASLYFMFALFIIVSVWSNVFAYFVNSINKINLQLMTSVVAAIINIPLSIFFVKFVGLGLNGIVLATVISVSIFAIFGPVQAYRIVKG